MNEVKFVFGAVQLVVLAGKTMKFQSVVAGG